VIRRPWKQNETKQKHIKDGKKEQAEKKDINNVK
jgi:hypothetical protein